MSTPEHYSPVMPYYIVPDTAGFIAFITNVFNAKEMLTVPSEDGSLMHGEYSINGGTIMFGQASEEWKSCTCGVFVLTEDVDATYKLGLENGAAGNQEPGDRGYGRSAGFIDKWGNQWWINSPDM
ncbi:MAG: VOC family protein [Acidobacteria bacterium]|nr:VOC family protein [Acidobacteriota bacterium]